MTWLRFPSLPAARRCSSASRHSSRHRPRSLPDTGYGRLEAGGWYLVRRVNGHYDLRQVPAPLDSNLVAVRAIRASPFAQQPGWVYFAGYDANKSAAHNTAWIIRGPSADVISGR